MIIDAQPPIHVDPYITGVGPRGEGYPAQQPPEGTRPQYAWVDAMGMPVIDAAYILNVRDGVRELFNDITTEEDAFERLDQVMPVSVNRDNLHTLAQGLAGDNLGESFAFDEEFYWNSVFPAQLVCGSFSGGDAGLVGIPSVIVQPDGTLIQVTTPVGVVCIDTRYEGLTTDYYIPAQNSQIPQITSLAINPIPATEVLNMASAAGEFEKIPQFLRDNGWSVQLASYDLNGVKHPAVDSLAQLLSEVGIETGNSYQENLNEVVDDLVDSTKKVCELPLEIQELPAERRELADIETFNLHERKYLVCAYDTTGEYDFKKDDAFLNGIVHLTGENRSDFDAVFEDTTAGILLKRENRNSLLILGSNRTSVIFDITGWDAVARQLEQKDKSPLPLPYVIAGIAALVGVGGAALYMRNRRDTESNGPIARRINEKMATQVELARLYGDGKRVNMRLLTEDVGDVVACMLKGDQINPKDIDIAKIIQIHRAGFILKDLPEMEKKLEKALAEQFKQRSDEAEAQLRTLLHYSVKRLYSVDGLLAYFLRHKEKLSSDELLLLDAALSPEGSKRLRDDLKQEKKQLERDETGGGILRALFQRKPPAGNGNGKKRKLNSGRSHQDVVLERREITPAFVAQQVVQLMTEGLVESEDGETVWDEVAQMITRITPYTERLDEVVLQVATTLKTISEPVGMNTPHFPDQIYRSQARALLAFLTTQVQGERKKAVRAGKKGKDVFTQTARTIFNRTVAELPDRNPTIHEFKLGERQHRLNIGLVTYVDGKQKITRVVPIVTEDEHS